MENVSFLRDRLAVIYNRGARGEYEGEYSKERVLRVVHDATVTSNLPRNEQCLKRSGDHESTNYQESTRRRATQEIRGGVRGVGLPTLAA